MHSTNVKGRYAISKMDTDAKVSNPINAVMDADVKHPKVSDAISAVMDTNMKVDVTIDPVMDTDR